MRNYRNAESPEQKPKKPSTQKSNFENEKNGLKTEFSMAWYIPSRAPAWMLNVRDFPSTTRLWRKWIYTESNEKK